MAIRAGSIADMALFAVLSASALLFPPALSADISLGLEEKIIKLLGEPVAEAELAELRGGFFTEDGLHFRFSYETVTRVNGEALAQTSFEAPLISMFGSVDGRLAATMAEGHAFQSLDSVMQATQLLPGIQPLILQNALDNQVLQTISTLNLEIFGVTQLAKPSFRAELMPTLISSLSR